MPESKLTKSQVSDLVKLSRGISYEEVLKISSLAEMAGGHVVSFDAEDDNRCGSCGVKIPIKPGKKPDLSVILDGLLEHRINFEVLINGIPVPEELYIQFYRSKKFKR